MNETYIDPYEFEVEVNGNKVNFGFDGVSKMVLFGGSFSVDHRKKMTLEEIKNDIIANYDNYLIEDRLFFCRCNGFYD